MKKFTLLLLLSVLLILPLTGCSRPPELASVKEEFGKLIEASEEINDLLWGEGLPYYDVDSEFAKQSGIYGDNPESLGNYRYVTKEALEKYPSAEDIRNAAEKVYSQAFLSGVSTSLFDGNMISNGEVSVVSRARYAELNQNLCILVGWNSDFSYSSRTFNLDTMQIVKKLSSNEIVTVTVESAKKDGSDPRTLTLRFVREENGWRLDSPTY